MNEIELISNAVIAVECNNPTYTAGVGTNDNWKRITYDMGEIQCETFPCQWTNAFGKDVFAAQSQNINELATIRMGFNPELWKALNTTQVHIFLNDDVEDESRAFVPFGSCDNVKMQNKILEFKVQRLAVKPNAGADE